MRRIALVMRNFIKRHKAIKYICYKIIGAYRYFFVLGKEDKAQLRAFKKFQREGGDAIRTRYDLKDDDIVMDLGGYVGDFTASLPNRNCQVYLFEPVKRFYEECERRFAGRKNIKCYNFGLDAETHDGLISDDADGSSAFREIEREHGSTVRFESIIDFIDNNDIERVKLIKINIEGGEYNILEELIKTGYIKKFDIIQVQFHFIPEINASERMEKIQSSLLNSHVLTWAYRPYVWESWEIK